MPPPLKSIASMPAMAGPSFRPLVAKQQQERLTRSVSLGINMQQPTDRVRVMARRVPFYAAPGVGSQLTTFVRSYSRANLARLSSTVNFGAFGSTHNVAAYGSSDTPDWSRSPSGSSTSLSEKGDESQLLFGEDELEAMQPGWTFPLALAVFTSVLASFQVGYNSGVLNVPQMIVVAALHLTTIEWSVVVAIFCVGGLIGSLSGGRLADQLGRKNYLIANNVLFIIGGLMEALAASVGMLVVGRLMIGVGCGGATVVVPMYLGEIAPANLRGSLGSMNQFSIVVGILIANLLGKPLGTPGEWRYLLGLCLAPSLLQIILSATLLESPLWLVQQGGTKNRVQAEEVLSRLRGTDDIEFDMECMVAEVEGVDADEEDEESDWYMRKNSFSTESNQEDFFADVQSYQQSGEMVRQHSLSPVIPEHGSLASGAAPAQLEKEEKDRRASLFNPDYRRPLFIGFGLQLAQQFSGINAVFFYSTMFFSSAHLSDPWLGSVLASLVNVLATALSIYLIERTGRRPLLLWSTGGMMLSCIGLTWALQQNVDFLAVGETPAEWVGVVSIAMVLVYVTFFEIGLGPIPWLIGSEIFPQRIRTQALTVSSTLNWSSNFAVSLTFPSIALALGPMSFIPFGVILFVAFVLEWIYVPETQGKTLEEIQDEFEELAARAMEEAQAQAAGKKPAPKGKAARDADDDDDEDEEEFRKKKKRFPKPHAAAAPAPSHDNVPRAAKVGSLIPEAAEDEESEDSPPSKGTQSHSSHSLQAPQRGFTQSSSAPRSSGLGDQPAGGSSYFLGAAEDDSDRSPDSGDVEQERKQKTFAQAGSKQPAKK